MKKIISSIFLIVVLIMSLTGTNVHAQDRGAGESCSGNECAAGLSCVDFVCTENGSKEEGDSCTTTSECGSGLECIDFVCAAAGTTSSPATGSPSTGAPANGASTPANGSNAGTTSNNNEDGTTVAGRGRIEYESFTSFPGVGRVSNLCELTDGLWQLGIVVLITSVFGTIVYAGFKYVTAGVNVNGVSEAKQRFISAVTGLVLGLSSVLILSVLNVDLLRPTCTLEFVGAGTNAFSNTTFGGASSGQQGGAVAGGPVPPAGTPCDDGSGLGCVQPGDVSSIVITSCFYRNSNGAFHGGTDWVVIDGSPGNNGAPVAAMTAGVVVEVCRGGCGGFGNNVTLRGPSQGGYDLYNYSHLTSIAPGIEEGLEVGQGTILGGQGCTGSCGGTHVDTKISNCILCKRQGGHYTKPTAVIRSYLQDTYGVSPQCNCRNGCNDT